LSGDRASLVDEDLVILCGLVRVVALDACIVFWV
jgi:hypothetical protein